MSAKQAEGEARELQRMVHRFTSHSEQRVAVPCEARFLGGGGGGGGGGGSGCCCGGGGLAGLSDMVSVAGRGA